MLFVCPKTYVDIISFGLVADLFDYSDTIMIFMMW